MFKITPIQDKSRQKLICNACGVEFREDLFAYEMHDADTGRIMGISQFEIGACGYIADLREPAGESDFEAMFILGRQTMNFINACGADICTASPSAADERLLHAIGFKDREGDLLVCNMTGMFDGHCGNH